MNWEEKKIKEKLIKINHDNKMYFAAKGDKVDKTLNFLYKDNVLIAVRNFGFNLGLSGFSKYDNYYCSLEYTNLLKRKGNRSEENFESSLNNGIKMGNILRNTLLNDKYHRFYDLGYEEAKMNRSISPFDMEEVNIDRKTAEKSYLLGYNDYFKDYYYYQGMKQAFDGVNVDDTSYDKDYDAAFWIGYFTGKDLTECEFDSKYYDKGINGDVVSEEEKNIPSYILGCKVVEMDNFFESKGKKK